MADFKVEKSILSQGFRRIAGVDEVGRGALFGPVVAAAVIFPEVWYSGQAPRLTTKIVDSKCLTATKRKELARFIMLEAEAIGIGFASVSEIDRLNIHNASNLAMKRAVGRLSFAPDYLLVDGFIIKNINYKQMNVIHGDKRSRLIAAASIVAKYFRDELMLFLDSIYSGYGLADNKGYATRKHYRALEEKGPTSLHRFSFSLKWRSLDNGF